MIHVAAARDGPRGYHVDAQIVSRALHIAIQILQEEARLDFAAILDMQRILRERYPKWAEVWAREAKPERDGDDPGQSG